MSSDIDKKIQEYKDVQATDPEKLETLEAFDAAIQETRNAIAMVLLINDDTKFSKKKNLEPFQKHLVSILEQRENLLKDHPKHQKLKAQRQEFIEKQQIEDAQKAKDDLLRISLENVQTTFLNTPVDAKNIPISEFDLFYQNSYITLITNPGEMYTDPVSVEKKKPKKKVIIRNAAELQKQDFMKSILSSTIATEGRGIFKNFKTGTPAGCVIGTILISIGDKNRDGLYAIMFNNSLEDAVSVSGEAYLNKINLMGKTIKEDLGVLKPDVEIKHPEYVRQKCLQYKFLV